MSSQYRHVSTATSTASPASPAMIIQIMRLVSSPPPLCAASVVVVVAGSCAPDVPSPGTSRFAVVLNVRWGTAAADSAACSPPLPRDAVVAVRRGVVAGGSVSGGGGSVAGGASVVGVVVGGAVGAGSVLGVVGCGSVVGGPWA